MVAVAQSVAELVFSDCGRRPNNPRDILVHREIDERLAKALQILEYAGFVSKREASRGLKSGGRGALYALSLCNLLEQTAGSRLTRNLFDKWLGTVREEAVQFSRGSKLADIEMPNLPSTDNLAIFAEPISSLQKSQAYPYGLSEQKIQALSAGGFHTVGDLVDADDETLDRVRGIGTRLRKSPWPTRAFVSCMRCVSMTV